jgi:hypothetical protein
MGASLLQATQRIKAYAHTFNKPLLILHGKQDSVTNYHDSIFFYDKCSRYLIYSIEAPKSPSSFSRMATMSCSMTTSTKNCGTL